MAAEPGSRTSVTLLERVSRGSADSVAWDEFARQYRPRIYQWCRSWGVQEADAEDVAQLVLAKLLKFLSDFEYDRAKSFRGWLKTVSRRVWSDLRERQDKVFSGDSLLRTLEAHADLEAQLEATYDYELLELAMEKVRTRIEPSTWEAFRLTAIEGQPAALVAQRLTMAVGNVYVAKHRVQKLIQQTIRDFNDASDSGARG
jgi:RNA polymerase sigma-70 factor (ECF subfamily)